MPDDAITPRSSASTPPRVGRFHGRVLELATAIYASPRLRRGVYQAARNLSSLPGGRQLVPLAMRGMTIDETRPQRLALHINSACNLSCSYCYADKSLEALPAERWLELVDEGMRSLGLDFVQILGGEPLLHPQLPAFLDALHQRRLMVAINTNGTLLTDAWLERLRPRRRRLLFFVNFDRQEGYTASTGRSDLYHRVLADIRRWSAASMQVQVFLTVTRDNAEAIPALVEMFDAMGVGSVVERCLPVHPQLRAMEVRRGQWQRLLEVLDARGMMNSPNRLFGEREGRSCMDYGRIIYLLQDGTAIPCAFAPRELSIGNVQRDSLATIWQRMQAEKERWHVLPDECGACDHATSCGGGCKTHAWLEHRRFDRRDPLCDGQGPPPTVVGL